MSRSTASLDRHAQPAAPMEPFEKSPGASVALRYNPVFYPEYISILIISLGITWIALSVNPPPGRFVVQNPHVGPAVVGYLFVAGLLAYKMMSYRRRYPSGRLIRAEDDVRIELGDKSVSLQSVERIDETVGRVFGRKARILRLFCGNGERLDVSDPIFQYDGVTLAAATVSGRPIEVDAADVPRIAKLRERWHQRHQVFPPGYGWKLGNIASRLFCLIPILLLDVFFHVFAHLFLEAGQHADLVVYVPAVGLLLSALLSRYFYYYLFTSAVLNR